MAHVSHSPTSLEAVLRSGLDALDVRLSDTDIGRLLHYVHLLERWNRAYNLTAVRDPKEMIPRHLLDSLAVMPFLHGGRVLDFGTGAGLPGIPLALARPDVRFTLLDSSAKKTRFVTQAVAELGLANVTVTQQRLEGFCPDPRFDTLIARAFGTIADMLQAGGQACLPGGRFLAMKGVYPHEELAALPVGYQVLGVERLTVPGMEAARHLVILSAA
jgi:16S rRNA (guanine527-N7)-methyltransferase